MNRTIQLNEVLEHSSYEQLCSNYLTDTRKHCAKALTNIKRSYKKPGPLLKLYKKGYFASTEEFTKCAIRCLAHRSLLPTDQQVAIRSMFRDISLQVLQAILKKKGSSNNGNQ